MQLSVSKTWITQTSAGVYLRRICAGLVGAMVRSVVAENTVYSKNGAVKVEEFRTSRVSECAADRRTGGQSTPLRRRPACLRDEAYRYIVKRALQFLKMVQEKVEFRTSRVYYYAYAADRGTAGQSK